MKRETLHNNFMVFLFFLKIFLCFQNILYFCIRITMDKTFITIEELIAQVHLREGTRTSLQAPHRAGGSVWADEIRHAVQTLPPLRQGQGHYGLCLLCHRLQHQENDCHNEKGCIKTLFMLFLTLYRGPYNPFQACLVL